MTESRSGKCNVFDAMIVFSAHVTCSTYPEAGRMLCIKQLLRRPRRYTYIDSNIAQLRPRQCVVHVVFAEVIFWQIRDVGLLNMRDVRHFHHPDIHLCLVVLESMAKYPSSFNDFLNSMLVVQEYREAASNSRFLHEKSGS